MMCEIVSVETRDNVILHGAFYKGDPEKPAVMILHGAAMNFYTGLGRFLPGILNHNGFTCLSVNNRGHDFGTAPDSDKKPVLGLMREFFKDCVHDITAWINYLRLNGYKKIILLGHSQAIPKILYSQNTRQYPEVSGLVLVSPPPSVSKMMRFLVSDNYYERGLFRAKELKALDMEDQLIVLRGTGTMPWVFTPETFLSFYGPDTPADSEELIRKIFCPVLLVRGSLDFEPVSRDLTDRMKTQGGNSKACKIAEIEGADHFYTRHEEELGRVILQWLHESHI